MAKINFLDLGKINGRFREPFLQATQEVLDAGWFIRGRACGEFEKEFAKYCGAQHCVGVANGLDALVLIFRAYKLMGDLKDGDEVLVQANTYIASVLAITANGLSPVLVEPSAETFNLEATSLSAKISPRTRAILCVHLYGRCTDTTQLRKLAKHHQLLFIEDAAQSHGAEFQGVRAGNLSDAAGFSFYPGKNLGCLGDGGAITTNDPKLAQMVSALGNYGSEERYVNQYPGTNSRLDELQAAYLLIKLKALDADNNLRRSIAKRYLSGISNPKITLPSGTENPNEHVWHLFVIRCAERSRLQAHLEEAGIQTHIHYPIAPHKQPALPELHHLNLPLAEKLSQEVLSLPIGPVMTDEEVNAVICAVNEFR